MKDPYAEHQGEPGILETALNDTEGRELVEDIIRRRNLEAIQHEIDNPLTFGANQ